MTYLPSRIPAAATYAFSESAGLPTTSGRHEGDEHFDTTALAYYVLISGAWARVTPVVAGNNFTSTSGAGLPTTVGRYTGDEHYNTTNLSQYVLVGGSWVLVAPAATSNNFSSTSGAGLPSTSGRFPGDEHYDTTAGRQYVLIGSTWTLVSPTAPISTTGFGLPTTSGRTAGDIHYDRLSQREYTLVAGSWLNTSGALNTVQAGLPPFLGRAAGDHAFDSTALKDYVLTGVAGSSDGDDFSRADTTPGSGSIGSSSGGRAWIGTSPAGQRPYLSSGKAVGGSANNRGQWMIDLGSVVAGGSVQARLYAPAGPGDLSYAGIALGYPNATDWSQGSGSGGWNVTVEFAAASTGPGIVNLQKPDGTTCQYSSKAIAYGTSALVTLVVSTDGKTGTVYLDGVALTGPSFGSPTSSTTATSTYAGFIIKQAGTPTTVGGLDDWSASLGGSLAWTVSQPAVTGYPISTTGLGLPTTSGRNEGDLHFDKVGQREYTLVNGVWTPTSGAVNTVGTALPTFSGRSPGDHAFVTTSGKDYVLTGAIGTTKSDDFSGTLAAYTNAGFTIVGGKLFFNNSSGGNLAFNLGTGITQTAQVEISPNATANDFSSMGVCVKATTPADMSTGYFFRWSGTSYQLFRGGSGIGSAYTPPTTANGTTVTLAISADTAGNITGSVNGVVVCSAFDGSPLNGTYSGLRCSPNGTTVTSYLDNFYTFGAGTLAWTLSQPASGTGLMSYRGGWSSSATYLTNDVVTRAYALYVALAGSTNIDPLALGASTPNIGAAGGAVTPGANSGSSRNAQPFTVTQIIYVTAVQVYALGGTLAAGSRIGIASALGTGTSPTFVAQGTSPAIGSGSWGTTQLTTTALLLPGTTYYVVVDEPHLGYTQAAPVLTGYVASAADVQYGAGNYTNVIAGYYMNFRLDGYPATGAPWQKIANSNRDSVNEIMTAGAAQTIPDPDSQALTRLTLTSASCALTFPTAAGAGGKSLTLVLVQDATGGRVVTWPSSVIWPGGVAPTLSSTALKGDVFTFLCTSDSTGLWVGFIAGQNI